MILLHPTRVTESQRTWRGMGKPWQSGSAGFALVCGHWNHYNLWAWEMGYYWTRRTVPSVIPMWMKSIPLLRNACWKYGFFHFLKYCVFRSTWKSYTDILGNWLHFCEIRSAQRLYLKTSDNSGLKGHWHGIQVV